MFLFKEIQEVVKPLTITDSIFFSSKFCCKGTLIIPNSRIYKIVSMFANIFFITLHFVRINLTEIRKYDIDFLNTLVVLNLTSLILEYMVNFLSGVLKSESVVQIMQNIENIDRKLKINSLELKECKLLVRAVFIFSVACQILTATSNFLVFGQTSILQFCITSCRFSLDVNIIYSVFFVHYATNRLNKLIVKVKDVCINSALVPLDNQVPIANISKETETMLNVFRGIISILKLTEKVFGLPIFYAAVEIFGLCLIHVQANLTMAPPTEPHTPGQIFMSIFHFFTWVFKLFTLLTLLCVKCEVFNTTMARAKAVCLNVLKNSKDDAIRRFCKNVLRVSACEYNTWSACGLITVDARLPLRVVGVVATYTVVLLQFALL